MKHQKTCGTRDRKVCQYYSKAFDSFAGLRLHERKTHSIEYKELESQLLGNDAVFTKMVEIEVRCAKGRPFIKDMVEPTRLTRDQIRHRRSKPIYNEYIELAKRNRALLKEPREPPISAPPTIGETFEFDSAQLLLDVVSSGEPATETIPTDSVNLYCRRLTLILPWCPLHHQTAPTHRHGCGDFGRPSLLARGPIFSR